MRKLFLLSVLWLLAFHGIAQNTRHLYGYVLSELNGKTLGNAIVSVPNDSVETFTNANGFFSLVVSSDTVNVVVERTSYEVLNKQIILKEDKPVILDLLVVENLEYTGFIPGSITNGLVYSPQSDQVIMDKAESRSLPFIFCEQDVVKALQIYPGVEFASDGYSDMVVRGGGLGQNLMLLDGAPVYGLGHLGGYVSNFNTEMVDEITLYKGAFPARYGGRLSSITEVKSNTGNAYDPSVRMATSPILANLNIGLPLDQKGSSVGIGFRRSYIDLLINTPDLVLVFRDFNAKLNLVIDDKNTVAFNYFSLKDRAETSLLESDSFGNPAQNFEFKLRMLNRTSSAKWNHIHNKKLTASYGMYYTHFTNSILLEEQNFQPGPGEPDFSDLDAKFSAGELSLNADYEFRKDKKHLIRFGLQNKLHQYNSGSLIETNYDDNRQILEQDKYGDTVLQNGLESALYIEDEFKFSSKLKVNVGLRNILYSYQDYTNFFIEPRIMGRYLLNDKSSVKFSYTRVNQFTHLYNTDGDATDDFVIWMPASDKLKPQSSNIFTAGYTARPNSNLQLLSEVYYKTLANQPLFYSADLFDRTDIVANSLVGRGVSMGWENSLRYVNEQSVYFISGTLSRSTRTFDDLNRGESFFFDYDRRLVGKAGFIFNSSSFILSITGVIATGNPFTLPSSKYRDIDGGVVLAYDEINNYRASAHNRIDMKAEWFFSDGVQSLEFMIYNLFGNRNISSIYSERDASSTNYRYRAFTSPSYMFLPFITYRLRIE